MSLSLRHLALFVAFSFCTAGSIQNTAQAAAKTCDNDACVNSVVKLTDKYRNYIIFWFQTLESDKNTTKAMKAFTQIGKPASPDELMFTSIMNRVMAFRAIEMEEDNDTITDYLVISFYARLSRDVFHGKVKCEDSIINFYKETWAEAQKENIDLKPYYAKDSQFHFMATRFGFDFGQALKLAC